MANPKRYGGEGAAVGKGASAVDDALQEVAHCLARLQEALRLQKQEAERRLQEALRLQKQETEHRLQEALRLQKQEAERRLQEVVRLQEQKLQEKDGAIRALQHRLDARRQDKETVVEVEALTSEGPFEKEALECLKCRVLKVEASLQLATEKFFPRVEALLYQLEVHSPPGAPHSATFVVNADHTTSTGGELASASPGALCTSSAREATGKAAASAGEDEHERQLVQLRKRAADDGTTGAHESPSRQGEESYNKRIEEEDRERQRVQIRVREAEERRARAQASPCPLGEDVCTAAGEGRVNDVRRLLDSGADVNYIDQYGLTPLLLAVRVAEVEVASLLLERGADANAVSAFGISGLHFASSCDWSDQCVSLLIDAGADVDARDLDGRTPLHHAALKNNEAAARALLAAGARSDLKCWDGVYEGKTPLDIADTAAVRKLLCE